MTIPSSSTAPEYLPRSIIGASFLLPIVNGAMHLPPAIAAIQIAHGENRPLDTPILLLLFALHVLIDVLDKYADLPSDTRKRWLSKTVFFASPFVALVTYGTWCCGAVALVRLLTVPILAVVHAIPLIPTWSWRDRKISLVKLKYFLGPFKSVFGATCIGLMDTTSIVLYLCETGQCQETATSLLQLQVLMYTILYDFLWESIADLRDVNEDLYNGVTTLATAFGTWRTLVLLAMSTIIGDLWITNIRGGSKKVMVSLVRSVFFFAVFSALALVKPRKALVAWGAGMLVGLLPVWLASITIESRGNDYLPNLSS